MIPRLPGPPRDQPPPLVLVAEPDERIAELLAFALKASHFRVAIVADGEDALRRMRAESPELVIAEVNLPGRGGLELCDLMRRELELSDTPVMLLSAAPETEARIEALAHGADDFIAKPFSPKELVARAQRLVTRARETARHRRRSVELERDLDRLTAEAQRARDEAARERSLRTLSGGVLGELLRTLDLDELDARVLREACRQSGARSAALLAPDGAGRLAVAGVRGDLPERWAGLTLSAEGACVHWLGVLGRPALRAELERLPGRTHEIEHLAAHGVALLGSLRAGEKLEGLVVCEDRADGHPFAADDRVRLAALLAAAGPARANARHFRAQQDRALELLAAPASPDPTRRAAATEAAERLVPLAASLSVDAPARALLELALALGPWVWGAGGRAALAALVGEDPTRRMQRLQELLRAAEACADGAPGTGEDVLELLVAAGLRYQSFRLAGRSVFESWRTAGAWLGVQADPVLRASFPEVVEAGR